MEAMAQTASGNASGAEPGSAGDPQTGNMQETPLVPIQLTPQRMQSIGVVLGKVESKPVNTELRFYGNVQVDERRQAYVLLRGDFQQRGDSLDIGANLRVYRRHGTVCRDADDTS